MDFKLRRTQKMGNLLNFLLVLFVLVTTEIHVVNSNFHGFHLNANLLRIQSAARIPNSDDKKGLNIQEKINAEILKIEENLVGLKSMVSAACSYDSCNTADSDDLESISNESGCSDEEKKFMRITASSTIAAPAQVNPQLTYMESMTAGAVSRSIAATVMHPVNTYKTILQLKKNRPGAITLRRLLKGVDAQFLFSVPSGAFQFWVMEEMKDRVAKYIPKRLAFVMDLAVSTASTVICSIFTTPQMVVTDRVMAGVYPDSGTALSQILRKEGLFGFYSGWAPALAQKIPSYAMTWMFFQQMKRVHERFFKRQTNGEENFFLGAVAAAASVCVMIPMDTVKTRLVVQDRNSLYYKGVGDCFMRIFKEEGIGAFYRSLAPRLMSVVPMIAIQFAVYEGIKSSYMQKHIAESRRVITSKLQRKPSALMADVKGRS